MTTTTGAAALMLARGHHHVPHHHGGDGLDSTFLHSVVASLGWHTVSWLFHSPFGLLMVAIGVVAFVVLGVRWLAAGRRHR